MTFLNICETIEKFQLNSLLLGCNELHSGMYYDADTHYVTVATKCGVFVNTNISPQLQRISTFYCGVS